MRPEYRDRVKVFLRRYGNPTIVVVSTLKEGAAACIKPVPTLFGPEIHCRAEDLSEVRKLCNQDKP